MCVLLQATRVAANLGMFLHLEASEAFLHRHTRNSIADTADLALLRANSDGDIKQYFKFFSPPRHFYSIYLATVHVVDFN